MNEVAYFVDTSYLTEFYKVPGKSDDNGVTNVRKRFEQAWTAGRSVFLPAVCALELGNLIAQVKNESDRMARARQLGEHVKEALGTGRQRVFTVVDAPMLSELSQLIDRWVEGHVSERRGLVDAAVAERARAYKGLRKLTTNVAVHIWTRDRLLKNQEPDPEPDPFV